jgi:hypothetical protein
MSHDFKAFSAVIAVCLTIVGYIPYLRGIYSGKVKPHLFTWIVWFTTTSIAALVQFTKGAAEGAWPTMIAAALCCWVTWLSLGRGSKDIRKIDWCCLLASLCAVPLWVIAKDPTWSAILVTGVETVASFPTVRKSWSHPEQEAASMYLIGAIRFLLSIAAIKIYSVATVIYPAGMILMSAIIIAVIWIRRARNSGYIGDDLG